MCSECCAAAVCVNLLMLSADICAVFVLPCAALVRWSDAPVVARVINFLPPPPRPVPSRLLVYVRGGLPDLVRETSNQVCGNIPKRGPKTEYLI